ncbi:MAG: DUF2927 domain-containing protein [Eubacteriales bacterium]|nr:DUF2927 domain-containing protein [Eubacteriales bacterium]
MQSKKLTTSPLNRMLIVALMFCLSLGLFTSPLLAETETDQDPKSDLINPLETPAEDPLADRKPFFDRKDEIDPAFFEAGIEYYKKVAGYEVRDVEMNYYVKKWTSPIRIGIEDRRGNAEVKKAYLEQMQAFVDQLNRLGCLPEISIYAKGDGPANIRFLVATQKYLGDVEFDGLKKQAGYYVNWTGDPLYRLFSATAGVAFDKTESDEECLTFSHQALVQMLGFLSLAPDYEDSIFYSEVPASPQLSELDWLVLEMHYRPELKPGMDFYRAVEILENLYLGDADYDASKEPESESEKNTVKWMEDEAAEVKKLQEKWEAMGVDINEDGPRKTFYERRKDIDPEFFELGLEYYEIVAGHGEFDSADDGYVKKWDFPVNVYLDFENGPNDKVVEAMDRIVMQLNSLELLPEITWSDDPETDYNVHIVVAALDELVYIMPSAPPGNWGFFLYYWTNNPQYQITSADIGIADDVNKDYHMVHLLQEEFVQSLGLINDGELYADSIFNQAWGHIQYPGELDWLLIEMHYRPEIKPGMPMDEALDILRDLYLGE